MSKSGLIKIILAVSNDLSGDQRLHKMAASLMKNGWEPVILGRKFSYSKDLERPYSVRRMRMLFNKGPVFYFFFNLRVLFFMLFARADLFVANDLDTLPGVWLAAKIRRKQIIYDSHEYFTEVPELVGRSRKKAIWKWLEKKIQPGLKFVITVNESIAHLFREEYKQEVCVVKNLPMGGSRPVVGGRIPDGFKRKPIIIYQGAVNMGRGLEELIEAMELLEDYRLIVAGGGDILENVKNQVSNKGLDERIYFTGRLPFESLSWYTAQAGIGVSLEQDIGLNYRFSLPNKLFDYMNAGLPVVASDLPEIKRVVEDAGFGIVISDFSAGSLSQAIKRLWEDRDFYRECSENAVKNAPYYTWEKQEDILFDLYRRALESGI